MTSAALASTQYLKDMTATTAAASAAADNELELNFLSEFLLHEDFNHDPAANGGGPAYPHEMKLEANMALDTGAYSGGNRHAMAPLQPHFQYAPVGLPQQYAPRHFDHLAHSGGTSSPHSSESSDVADAAEQLQQQPLDRKAKRRQQVAISARRHRSRKKHELLDLRKEVSAMTSQLDFLRSKHKMLRPNGAVAEWEEKAMAQRRKRRQAEARGDELRRAIFMQSQFLGNLKSVFSNSPMFTEDLNLRQLLHTYTRLGRNPRSRQRDYEAICAPSKLQMATDILRRQTESIRFSTPYVKTQILDSVDSFGATIVSVYAFDTLDIARIFGAACNAIKASSNTWPEFTGLEAQHTIVDALPQSNIVAGKQIMRFRFAPTEDEEMTAAVAPSEAEKELVVDAHTVSFWHMTQHEAVLVWDYVDDDDLHPPPADCDIKRDVVGAMLVRRELCEDGKERVVCRSICSKIHARTNTSKAILSTFSTSPTRSLTRMCGNVVFESIRAAAAKLSA
jgi:hypothetical protein